NLETEELRRSEGRGDGPVRSGWMRGDGKGRRAARRRGSVKGRRVLVGRRVLQGDRFRGKARAANRLSSKVVRGLRGGCCVAAAAGVAAPMSLWYAGGCCARVS